MNIRTIIVDDEPLARERIRRFLTDEPDIEVICECGNGAEATDAILRERPDLIFLDIQMPEKNGFDVLQSLEGIRLPVFIFITAYDRYAVQAFDVHALDYLLKPFDRRRMRRAVARAREHLERLKPGSIDERLNSLLADLTDGRTDSRKYLDRLVVKTVGRIYFLKTEEIDWIEAAGNYIRLHVGREAHMIRETMNSVEMKLDPAKFVRIHRSAMVNIDRIRELHPMFSGDYSLILTNGVELALSRNYRERLLGSFRPGSEE